VGSIELGVLFYQMYKKEPTASGFQSGFLRVVNGDQPENEDVATNKRVLDTADEAVMPPTSSYAKQH